MTIATLGYWRIRGLAQPIRLLLGYTKTEFEDKMFDIGDAPTYDRSAWTDIKYTLGLDLPNLPYFIDGDVKLTMSNAILRYIARKNDMVGNTEKEIRRVDMMENELMDFRNAFVALCYSTKSEDLNEALIIYKTNAQTRLKLYSDFLGESDYLAGKKLTFVDFIFKELLDLHKLLKDNMLTPFPKLEAFMKRFEELPEICEFMSSYKFFKGPPNGKMAIIGGELQNTQYCLLQ